MLTTEQVKNLLTHANGCVRRAARYFLLDALPEHANLLNWLIESCRATDWGQHQEAFNPIGRLRMTESSRECLIGLWHEVHDWPATERLYRPPRFLVAKAVKRADPTLLLASRHEFVDPELFPDEFWQRQELRLSWREWPSDRLWAEVRRLAAETDRVANNDGPAFELESLCDDMAEELAPRDFPSSDEIVARLRAQKSDEFQHIAVVLCQLCGHRRIQSAIPVLIERLGDGYDVIDEAFHALTAIGSVEVVQEMVKSLHTGGSDFQQAAVDVLGHIPLPESEQALLDVLKSEMDVDVRSWAATELAGFFSESSFEYLKQLIQTGYDETMVDLVDSIEVIAAVFGHDLPDLELWRETQLKQLKQRRQQQQRKTVRLTKRKEKLEQQLKKVRRFQAAGLLDGSTDERTVIRVEEKIGRNDPCPCRSGKKYKKCCGAAGSSDE